MTLPETPTIRNVSKRIVRPVIRYIDGAYGPEITEKILSEIGQTRLYFDDLEDVPAFIRKQLGLTNGKGAPALAPKVE